MMKNSNLDINLFIKEIFKYLVLSLFFISLNSCEKYIEVDVPDSQLTGEAVYNEYTTAEAALTYIYERLRDDVLVTGEGTGISNLYGLYSDEITLYSGSLPFMEEFYTNNVNPSGNIVSIIWNDSYNLIYAANAVYEGVEDSEVLTDSEKTRLMGEALFIRAFIHSYLVDMYGDIPYIKNTDYDENTRVSKLSESQVYERIIEDLVQSKSMLDGQYLSTERVRPNKWTAAALLARMYLYNQDWPRAEEQANEIIDNSGLYILTANLEDVFLKDSQETIWQFMPAASGSNTLEARTFIFTMVPPPNIALSESLINSFELEDERAEAWLGSLGDSTHTWYFANKYKLNSNTGSSEEYSVLFRIAEQYFIRAEARLHLGNNSGSLTDINKIRNRAGLNPLENLDDAAIMDAILEERRHELFTEFGHRFFDLKRTYRANTVLEVTKSGWELTDRISPIPESELLLNPNLEPQNPGY